MACAAVAHADVINVSEPAASPGFLSGWTTGNGADVIGSGVLSGNVNLIGGIAYGSGAAGADVLLDKASGSLGSAAGSTSMYYTSGIDGMYLLGQGHGILAVMLGNGISIVGNNGGVTVHQGSTGGQTGGGWYPSGGGGSYGPGPGTGSNSCGSTGSSAGGSTGVSTGGSLDLSAGGTTGTGGGANSGGLDGGSGQGDLVLPPVKASPAATVAVPEPSTVALMLAGMLGAGALKRRRQR
jgi:hypothetical protein